MEIQQQRLIGEYLLNIKKLVIQDNNGSNIKIEWDREKNKKFIYNNSLNLESIKEIILKLKSSECFAGPELDRSEKYKYAGWIFKFSPMFNGEKLYIKLRVQKDVKVICISIHEDGLFD